MKNKIKEFTSYMSLIGAMPRPNWTKYSYQVNTTYGLLNISIHEGDFTSVGKPRSEYSNLVSIYTSFVDFNKAKPYLEKMKHPGDGMPVLNSKINYHLSGGDSAEENWNCNFERFKKDLEKILVDRHNRSVKEESQWCAWCGVWGDHTSRGCKYF